MHRQAGSSGPLTQSIVDQAHFLLLSLRFTVERVHQAGASPGSDSWDRFMVDVCVRVHGPHTRSMVDCVHPPFPLLVHGGQAQGVAAIPLFLSVYSRWRCRR